MWKFLAVVVAYELDCVLAGVTGGESGKTGGSSAPTAWGTARGGSA